MFPIFYIFYIFYNIFIAFVSLFYRLFITGVPLILKTGFCTYSNVYPVSGYPPHEAGKRRFPGGYA